jgi:UDP-N-acetyl-D-galactosamine dehydrogenase
MPQVPNEPQIAVIGLGYVGLPLAAAFAEVYPTLGFDIDEVRVEQLRGGNDATGEVTRESLARTKLTLAVEESALQDCNTYVITVPTPIDDNNVPLLRPLESASAMVGRHLKLGDVVIYESTVYPGASEEVCVPILEDVSGLTVNRDFSVGYSPERINPGDKTRPLPSIVKITSGSNPEAADYVDDLYKRIVEAGTHKVSSIRSAEAAKVIENVQRDVNIALVNEFAQIFQRLDIDTEEVLKAAGTKWNFIPMRPGLVGGHCIGVDPYYLANKAQRSGYFPELIAASRRINDGMGKVVSSRVIRLMSEKRIHVVDSNILVLGLAFKENCPDLRNTKVVSVVRDLQAANAHVDVYDPWVEPEDAEQELGFPLTTELRNRHYDAVIVAVGHDSFRQMGVHRIRELCKKHSVVFDVKYLFDKSEVDGRL